MDAERFNLRVTATVTTADGKIISTTVQENNDMSYATLVQAQGLLKGYVDALHEWGKQRASTKGKK